MSKILRAVSFYRNEKDRLTAYTLQLIQVDIIIEKQTSFFIQIITPEREVWTCGKPAEFPTIEKGANHD